MPYFGYPGGSGVSGGISGGARVGGNLALGAAQGAASGGGGRAVMQGVGNAALGMIPVVGPYLSAISSGLQGGVSNAGQTGLTPDAQQALSQRGQKPAKVKPPKALTKKSKIMRGIGNVALSSIPYAGPWLAAAGAARDTSREKAAASKYSQRISKAGQTNTARLGQAIQRQQRGAAANQAPPAMGGGGAAPMPGGAGTALGATALSGLGGAAQAPAPASAMPTGAVGGAINPGAAGATSYPNTNIRQWGQRSTPPPGTSGGLVTPTGTTPFQHAPYKSSTNKEISGNVSQMVNEILNQQLRQGLDPGIETGLYQAATQGAQTARQGLQDAFARTGDTSGYNYGIPAGIDMSLAQQLAGIHPAFLQQAQEYMNDLLFKYRGTTPGAVPPGGASGGGNLAGILSGVGGLAQGIGSLYSSFKPQPQQQPTTTAGGGGYFYGNAPGR